MKTDIILIAGPLVRASSWEPTAERLRDLGWRVQVPDVLAHCFTPPAWSEWSRCLTSQITSADSYLLVGHSSASALAAELATKLPARAIILVDGDVPPTEGPAYPVRPELRAFVQGLAGPDGSLPRWPEWFNGDKLRATLVGIDILRKDTIAFDQFKNGLPRMNIDWFDEIIDLARWDHIPSGYIQTSKIYDHASAEARRRGWPVVETGGTHLDPTLRPDQTANAIVSIVSSLEAT